MTEPTPNSYDQVRPSFANQPDLGEPKPPNPPQFITADDIPRGEPKPPDLPKLITIADIPRGESKPPDPPKLITIADAPRDESKPEQPTAPNSRRSVGDGVEVGRTLSGVETLRLRLARYFDEPDTNEPNPNAKYGLFYSR